MNLPNKLTMLRILAVPAFVILMMAGPGARLWAFIVFALASLTDMLDGRIARSRNLVTDFGKIMDPLADKILVLAAMVCLCELGEIPGWTIIIVLFREFLISGMRIVAAADTVGSELGVKDPRVWLITTFRRVEPGTDGGISLNGTLLSFAASVFVSVIGYLFIMHTLDVWVIVPAVCGMIGCLADSYVGATIETWGYVSKYTNNCMTGLLGGILAAVACVLL